MNEDFYISLFYKQLEGNISDGETQQLSEWLAADTENQALADDLAMVYSSSEDYLVDEIEAVDVNAAFEQQMQLLEEEEPANVIQMQSRRQRSFRLGRTLRIAAAVILLAVIGWVGYSTLNSPQYSQIQASAEPIDMADGSVINLTDGSSIWLDKDFNKTNRHIKLKGQGFFSIQKSTTPFVIETEIGKVTVLGTQFDLVYDEAAANMTVKVIEGLVNLELKNGKSQKVGAGEEGIASKNENTVTVSEEKVKIVEEFNDTPLHEVIEQISLKYEVEISVSESIQNCKVNLSTKGQELKTVFETIERFLEANVEKVSDGKYSIKGSSCR